VDLEKQEGQSLSVHFAIEDSGIGIPPDKKEKIFESFTQADGSTTRKYGGTGLGTSISKMLVELMGGKIWVESPNPNFAWSEENPGSVFHFTVPLKADKKNQQDDFKNPRMKSLKALIVDNHKTNLLLLKKAFHNWGITPVTVSDEKSASEKLRGDKNFDLILIDSHIFSNNEETGIQKIKEAAPKIKTLLFTSQNKHSFKGFDMVLEKPIKHTELFHIINQLIFGIDTNKGDENFSSKPKENKKILLVEDNPINQKITEKMLSRIGVVTTITNNGAEAVDLLVNNQETFDAILMDIQMPVLNGLDATRELRKAGISTPIIAMTANVLKGDREACLEAGMNDYIGKPVKLNDLQHTIQKWM
jgi:CheY-like chemotaxis protein